MDHYCLGIDCGSVSIKAALVDEREECVRSIYRVNTGEIILTAKRIVKDIIDGIDPQNIARIGITGSGRKIIGIVLKSKAIKNEIVCHSYAAIKEEPNVKTVIDIGGQDSKIILIRNQNITDFVMNTICAAGTGSFLEQQSRRLNIPIDEFGKYASRSTKKLCLSGRCAVFAESDMISLQQMGETKENIVRGLCNSLARNLVFNIGRGKDIFEPILFQGGVAANSGMRTALEETLQKSIFVPAKYSIMGAMGAALVAKRFFPDIRFCGLDSLENSHEISNFICEGCEFQCKIIQIIENGNNMAFVGDRCGKWTNII